MVYRTPATTCDVALCTVKVLCASAAPSLASWAAMADLANITLTSESVRVMSVLPPTRPPNPYARQGRARRRVRANIALLICVLN